MESCPKCRTATLQPMKSAAQIRGVAEPPRRCSRCRGFWVKLSSIGALIEAGAIESADEPTERSDTDARAGLCPEGHGILQRAKASWTRPFYVERCAVCDGLWLDAGEWKRLGAEHLLGHLEDLWLPAWRRRMQAEHSAARLQATLLSRLGPELTARIDALATELAAHEHGELGFALLREVFDERRPRRKKT